MAFLSEHQLTQLLIFMSALRISIESESCEVGVVTPFKAITYVPLGSSLRLSCTVNSSEPNPVWSVHLEGTETAIQFTFEQSINLLNSRGFYLVLALEENGRIKLTQLLINDTAGETGTTIACVDASTANVYYETRLFIYDPTPVMVNVSDISLQRVNISMRSTLQQDIDLEFTLLVTSSNTQPQLFRTRESSLKFDAPDGALPCEAYNFSVTANYVGATYTGANCSIPSQVLNRMLPSLPDIENIVPSLEKIFDGVNLKVSLQPLQYCEMYPVQSYSVEITESEHSVQNVMLLPTQIYTVHLSENTIYKFQIIVWNSVGSVNHSGRIYTTDVQAVKVQPCHNIDVLRVQCEFIKDTDAKGCLVWLLGNDYNHSVEIMRMTTDAIHTVELVSVKHNQTFYDVVAFDIESDNSIGRVHVPGHLESNAESYCRSLTEENDNSGEYQYQLHNE